MNEKFKLIAEQLPCPTGKFLARIPMSWRLGKAYNYFLKQITMPLAQLRQMQIDQLNNLIDFSFKNIVFYNFLYKQKGISLLSLRDLRELEKFPVISKINLQNTILDERSDKTKALKKSNTGGTTGQPLDFYLEKSAYAREWAHMHSIWAKLGYHYTDQKLSIRGKNIGNIFYKYNFNQNEFLINAYAPISDNITACRKLILKNNIKWIHGYPSSIFSFLRELEKVDCILFEILINKIQGVFLSSEFPAPQYRNYIEKHCGLKSISWYGHSEMAILAPEREPGSGIYYPFHSYGYTEAVKDGNFYKLVATSTHNYASPFIRYDTGDLIEPNFEDGLLKSFRIKEGRNSDNVIDQNNREISLTGLIFGRHHKAFDHCDHVQVRQIKSGSIEILVTAPQAHHNWPDLFDFSNTFFDVTYTQIDTPIRTPLGKVQLLLRQE